jgi:hypothetical protein
MNRLQQFPHDIERMVDGLIGHVWPGGHRSPPIMDPRPTEPRGIDFAFIDGKAVPVVTECLTADSGVKA